MTPIGIAVIGTGRRGSNLVRNARATTGLDLRYLCDLDVERARRVCGERSTVAVSGSLDEVPADPAVAEVAIATSAATHLPAEVSAHGAASITEGRPPLTDGRAGPRVLAILEAATESVATGGTFVPVRQADAVIGGSTP